MSMYPVEQSEVQIQEPDAASPLWAGAPIVYELSPRGQKKIEIVELLEDAFDTRPPNGDREFEVMNKLVICGLILGLHEFELGTTALSDGHERVTYHCHV